MTSKAIRALLLAACGVLVVSLAAVGLVIGLRMAHPQAGEIPSGEAAESAASPDTGGEDTDTTPAADSAEDTQPAEPAETSVTVRAAVARRDDAREQAALAEALEAFADAYAAANPGTAVEFVWYKAVPDKPDGEVDLLLCTAADIQEYGARSQTTDLTEFVSACGIDLLPSALRMGQVMGTQVLVPVCYDRAVLYADKAAFEARGVSLPSAGYTYEQFEDMLVRLTGEAGGTRYVGVHMPYYMPFVWLTYVRGLSGEPVVNGKLVLSTGGNYEALRTMFTVLDYGYAQSHRYDAYSSDKAYCAMSWTSACHPDMNGRYTDGPDEQSLNPGKNAAALQEAGRLVMLPLPDFGGSPAGTGISDTTYGFMRTTSAQAQADSVISFALSAEGQALLHKAFGGIPTNRALLGDDFWRTGVLACPGAENVLYGIEDDRPDQFCDMLTARKSDFYENSVRLKTMAWLYFYGEIGGDNHSVNEYYKPHLADLETWANKMTK